MTQEQPNDTSGDSRSKLRKTLLISLGVLLAGGVVTAIIFMTEPEARRGGATKKTAMLVDVMRVERDTFRPAITVMGTVTPARDITLSPRVSGQVVHLEEGFTPGAFVKKGDVLLQIERADYENALQTRKSELRQAVADLKIEMGRQNIAEQDYQLLNQTLSEEQEALILRKPQLNAARSRVEAARAAVRQAELDLQRTTIKAPFDAHVLSRKVNVGSQVATGQDLGRLVGMDAYWVEATVPQAKVHWLEFPRATQERGSRVRIHNSTAWPAGTHRTGYLYKLVGTLDDNARMAKVIVKVPDPLGQKKGAEDVPELMLGSYVEAALQARPLTDVIRLNRDYVRKDEKVWVMQNHKLQIREVSIDFRDPEFAYISKGLQESDSVVTTNLSTVVEGADLRLGSK